MILPPRVKTQYPRTDDIPVEVITPIPIETVFFLSDGQQDQSQLNRYYFNYPGNWATANNGENIIGLRSIKIQRTPIKLSFTIQLAKYDYENYYTYYQNSHDDTIDFLLDKNNDLAKTKELDIVCWIKQDDFNFDNFFDTVHQIMMNKIKKGWFGDAFVQSENDPLDRDISVEGFYNKDGYHVRIYSERNPFEDKNLSFKIIYANDEFKEIFNFPTLSDKWQEEIVFNKVWDLKPCYVYSSIAEQSHHHYIGTTDVEYSEIKYYKLNSSDQRFWVEFRSMGRNNTPSYFPKNVSFAIEIQFQSFNKRLNI